jgi:K+-transporting ATPase A subunit
MDNELFYQMFRKILKVWVPMAFVTAIFVIIAGATFKYDEIDFKDHSVSSTAEIIGASATGYFLFRRIFRARRA